MQQLILVSLDHKSSLSKKKDKYIHIYYIVVNSIIINLLF